METKQACKAMAWGEKKYTFQDLRQVLQKGSTEHQKLSKLASQGQGFDRHWFALKCLANKLQMDMPSIFTDPNHRQAYEFTLSTSHLYGNHFVGGGYGPVVPEGFGLAYGFSDTGMTLNCSTFETQNATEFAQAFMESLQEINNVLERS
jgi:carnitine O-palmitoyltransferase 2